MFKNIGRLATLSAILYMTTFAAELPAWVKAHPVDSFHWLGYGLVDSEPAAVWDSVHECFLSWGGHYLYGDHAQSDDVWSLSLCDPQWRMQPQINAPRASCCANQLAYDSKRGLLATFGDDGDQSHGWIPVSIQGLSRSIPALYDASHNHWTHMRPQPCPPDGVRQHRGFVYHPAYDLYVLFSGKHSDNKTWLYDPYCNEWSMLELTQAPSARAGHVLCVHPETNEVLLWGGAEDDQDLHVLNLEKREWRTIELQDAPPQLQQAFMCFDPHAGSFVLMGTLVEGKKTSLGLWTLSKELDRWQRHSWPEEGEGPGRPKAISGLGFMAAFAPEANMYLVCGGVFGIKNFHTWSYRLAPTRTLVHPQFKEASADWSSGKLSLRWTGSLPKATFSVMRAEGHATNHGKYENLATTTDVAYEDRTAKQGAAYLYRIIATLPDGRTFSTPPVRSTLPAPARPTVSVTNDFRAKVRLPAVQPGQMGFVVERARLRTRRYESPSSRILTKAEFSDWLEVARVAADHREFLDEIDLRKMDPEWPFECPVNPICCEYAKEFAPKEQFNALAVYAYRVRAISLQDAVGGPSPWQSTLPEAPDTPKVDAPSPDEAGNGIVGLSWNNTGQENVIGYRVHRQKTKLAGPEWSAVWEGPFHSDINRWRWLNKDPQRETSFKDDSQPGSNSLRRYYVTAMDAFGQEGPPSSGAWAYRATDLTDLSPLLSTPKLLIPELNMPASVDGSLEDEIWSRAAQLELRCMDGTQKPPMVKTQAKLFTSKGMLFVGAFCFEDRMDEIVMHPDWPHDSNYLWKDDTFEISFVLGPDAQAPMHHFMVSASGVYRDEYGPLNAMQKKAWDPEVQCKVLRKEDRWLVELGFPLEQFVQSPKLESIWRVNILRMRQQSTHRSPETSAWAPSYSPEVHVPNRLGYVGLVCRGGTVDSVNQTALQKVEEWRKRKFDNLRDQESK